MTIKYLIIYFLNLVFTIQIVYGIERQVPYIKSHIKNESYLATLYPKTSENSKYLHDRIIVKIRSQSRHSKSYSTNGLSALQSYLKKYSVNSMERIFPTHEAQLVEDGIDLSLFYMILFTSPIDVFKVARELSAHPEVEYAEPWYIYSINNTLSCVPNDSLRSYQWALSLINADSAWCLSNGDSSVIIGIIDTGVQLDHPDLQGNIWVNPGESGFDGGGNDKRFNGIDDDQNGKVDDWRGWDFGGALYQNTIEDNNPSPTASNNAHGTHVAGIASAVTNNGIGISGVGYNCSILPVKVTADNDTRDGGWPYILYGFQGIVYAADVGADVINCSWAGEGYSRFEQDIINYATQKGALVVAAAGNGNTSKPFFPAAYNNVFSVSAIQYNDVRANYSNYGTTIDVSAPGGSTITNQGIYSTYYPSTYKYMAGTSMAAPFVAGLAALVKSYFKNYTMLQVAEQIRISCDNINSVNPSYVDKLGKGRINAFKSLTNLSPSLRVISYRIQDSLGGNNNGIPEPGEMIELIVEMQNFLQPTTFQTSVILQSNDSYIQIENGLFSVGSVQTLQIVRNDSFPFKIRIGNFVPKNYELTLRLNTFDINYDDFQYISVLLNQNYFTHDINNVVFSVSNFGSFGYNDYTVSPYGLAIGEGFQFPKGTPSALYHASLMIGTDSLHLADNVYGNPSNPTAVDFQPSTNENFVLIRNGIADQVLSCSYNDSGISSPGNRVGVKVTQQSLVFQEAPNDAFVILSFAIKNITSLQINNVHIGIFADWDVNNYSKNFVDYDAQRRLGYMWDSAGSNYYGVALISPATANSYRAVNNSIYIYNGFWESRKFQFLSDGFSVVSGTNANDWSMILSAGPFSIASGESVVVVFAFLGGYNLEDLQQTADFALQKWLSITSVDYIENNSIPSSFMLYQNYPNPFNSVTYINYDLPQEIHAKVSIYDILGREVLALVNFSQKAGRYKIPINARNLSSGIYFYRLQAGSFTDQKKLLLMK